MTTASFSLVAATPQVLLTGRFVIRQIVITAAAATVVSVYDASTTSTTQSNAAYSYRARTNPYTRTRLAVTDILGNANDYTYTGIGDAATTVALNATYPLPVLDSLSLPAAGQTIADNRLCLTRGLMANATVAATIQVTYDPLN
jgi:hypothetical protein